MSDLFRPNWSALPETYWTEIFGDDRPVAVEIGPGLGEFLEFVAKHQPDWNFFAVERSRARAATVRRRIDAARLTNARVLSAPAECVLAILRDSSVDRFYIQFPDPWWKRRHKRRRLMTPQLATQLCRVLRPGGAIEFITDVEEYYDVGRAALRSERRLIEISTDPELQTATSFARKAIKRGWKLHAATYRKLAVD